jgi:hypothetical protein
MKRFGLLSSIAFVTFAVSSSALAFTCFVTVAKDSCWTNYALTLNVTDTATNQAISTVEVPKGKSWTREIFNCQPNQSLHYAATYQPIFWADMKNKIYKAKSTIRLPEAIEPGQTAWDLTVCFPRDFAEVPFPPDAKGNCKCNLNDIPAVLAPEKSS